MFGTAMWLTANGQQIQTEVHILSLVERYFDFDAFKSGFGTYVQNNYATEDELEGIDSNEPNAPKLATDEEIEFFETVQELSPETVGNIPLLIDQMRNGGYEDLAEAVEELLQYCSIHGFDQVILGNIDPYTFAFRRGDIRVRLFDSGFVAQLSSAKLNPESAQRIIESLMDLSQNNPSSVPVFRLELFDVSSEETSQKTFTSFEDFEHGLDQLTGGGMTQKEVAEQAPVGYNPNQYFAPDRLRYKGKIRKQWRYAQMVTQLLKLATVYYKSAKSA